MDELELLVANMKGVNVWKVLEPILKRYLPEMLNQNLFQLDRGEDALGNFLDQYSSSIKTSAGYITYAEFKSQLNTYHAPYGIPDLELTGDFKDGMYNKIQGKGIEFGSKDEKEGTLESDYGVNIFGVQEEELGVILIEQVLPDFQEAMLNELLK